MQHPALVWGLVASVFVANVMLLVLNLPRVGLWVKLLKSPAIWLHGGILVFAAMILVVTLALVAPFLFRGRAEVRQDED